MWYNTDVLKENRKRGSKMRVYIGYILRNYTIPCWISLDKTALKKKIKEYEEEMADKAPETWITEYDLHKSEVLDLDD